MRKYSLLHYLYPLTSTVETTLGMSQFGLSVNLRENHTLSGHYRIEFVTRHGNPSLLISFLTYSGWAGAFVTGILEFFQWVQGLTARILQLETLADFVPHIGGV